MPPTRPSLPTLPSAPANVYNKPPVDNLGGGIRLSQTLTVYGQPLTVNAPFPQMQRLAFFTFQHKAFLTGFSLSTSIRNFGLQIMQAVICSNQDEFLNISSAKDVLCVHSVVTGQPELNQVTNISYSGTNCRSFNEKQGLSIFVNQQGIGTAVGIIVLSFDYRYLTLT